MNVTTSHNYRHSTHHSRNFHTHHDRNNHDHDSHRKNNHNRSNSHHNLLNSHEHNFPGQRKYYYQRCDALSFGYLKRCLNIKHLIVPYLFLLLFNIISAILCFNILTSIWATKSCSGFCHIRNSTCLSVAIKQIKL